MKGKKLLALCLAAALMLVCCACSKPTTPREVAEAMMEAVQETPCSHAQVVMDIAITLDAGTLGTVDLKVKTTNDVIYSQDPVSGYTTAAVEMDYGGEESQTFAENYSIMEDGELISYVHSDGVWMRVATGQTAEELASSSSSVSVDTSNVAIDETVTEYAGREAICLTTQISGEALDATLGGLLEDLIAQGGALGDTAEAMDRISYAALTCDARIYLDKETYLPIAEEMTFSGMRDVLNPLYEQLGVRADAAAYTATVTYLSYEAQEAVVLPEGAKEKAEKWTRLLAGEPDNGDGTFTIREGVALIDIAAPEGFEVTDKDYDHVHFRRDDYREIYYTVHYGSTDYLISQIDRQLARYGDLPKKVSREQIPLAGDVLNFETDIVGVEWPSYEEGLMYAWADLGSDGNGNYYLFVEIYDGFNDGMGNKKSVDVTPEEFMAYLNAAVPSELMN